MDCTLNWSYIHYGGLHCDSKYKQKIILVSYTRPLKFISAPRKAKHFIGQLWQLMTASNVGARTQAWQAKWVVFKIPGFVCKRFLAFFPTPSPLFYLRHLSRGQFDSCSSFFAPKPHRNACHAGEASPSTVFLFYYTSIFMILQPLGCGYHEIKVTLMNYPTETEHEAMG